VNFAEDGDGVDRGAVPASVSELLLTLVDGDHGARLHRIHHLDMSPTDVLLSANKSDQVVTLVLGSDVRQRSGRRY